MRPDFGNTNTGLAWGTISVVALFLSLALLFSLSRTPLLESPPTQEDGYAAHYNNGQTICNNEYRPCFRASGGILAQSIEGFYKAIVAPMFWDLSRSPIEAQTPWPVTPRGELLYKTIIPFATYLSYCILTLSPILLLTLRFFVHTGVRLAFIFGIFVTISGLHPALLTIFFNLAGTIFSWPRSYYLFQHGLMHYDFFALGMVAFTFVYAASERPKRAWEIFVIAAVGQLTIEHLGFVFAMGLAASSLMGAEQQFFERVRRGFRHLFIAGAGCVTAAVLSVALFYWLGYSTAFDAGDSQVSLLTSARFINNMKWFNLVIANVITMMVMALPGAVFAGTVAGFFARPEQTRPARLIGSVGIGVGAGITVAFLVTMLAGVFFLSYPAEMGRQFLPLTLAVMIAGTKAVEQIILKRRDGSQSTD